MIFLLSIFFLVQMPFCIFSHDTMPRQCTSDDKRSRIQIAEILYGNFYNLLKSSMNRHKILHFRNESINSLLENADDINELDNTPKNLAVIISKLKIIYKLLLSDKDFPMYKNICILFEENEIEIHKKIMDIFNNVSKLLDGLKELHLPCVYEYDHSTQGLLCDFNELVNWLNIHFRKIAYNKVIEKDYNYLFVDIVILIGKNTKTNLQTIIQCAKVKVHKLIKDHKTMIDVLKVAKVVFPMIIQTLNSPLIRLKDQNRHIIKSSFMRLKNHKNDIDFKNSEESLHMPKCTHKNLSECNNTLMVGTQIPSNEYVKKMLVKSDPVILHYIYGKQNIYDKIIKSMEKGLEVDLENGLESGFDAYLENQYNIYLKKLIHSYKDTTTRKDDKEYAKMMSEDLDSVLYYWSVESFRRSLDDDIKIYNGIIEKIKEVMITFNNLYDIYTAYIQDLDTVCYDILAHLELFLNNNEEFLKSYRFDQMSAKKVLRDLLKYLIKQYTDIMKDMKTKIL